jgi:hypothetical protein
MKTKTNMHLVISSSLALVLALAIWSPIQARSAEPAAGTEVMKCQKTECCQEMMQQQHKMMAEMKAQDAELTAQVAAMNSAPDDKKLGLLAAVVTRLVEQRTAMNARMEKMHDEMKQHTMGHKHMGRDSAAKCPMTKDMKDMKGMDEKPADAPKDQK